MEAHVLTMRTERYWQTSGKHKSSVGGGSVFSELSVARRIFINQEQLCLIREVWERVGYLLMSWVLLVRANSDYKTLEMLHANLKQ